MRRAPLLLAAVVVGLSVGWAQGGPVTLTMPEPASADEPAVKIDVQDRPLAEVLAQLSAASGYLFLAEPALRETKVTLEAEEKPFELVAHLSQEVLAYPYAAFFLCTEQQVPTKEPKVPFPDTKVTVQVADTDTLTALDLVALSAKLKLLATDEVLQQKPQMSLDLQDVPTQQALATIAQSLDCKLAKGLLLVKADPETLFQQFLNMPTPEQERLCLEATRRIQEMNLSDEDVDRYLDEAVEQFWQMPKPQRMLTVQTLAGWANIGADRMSRFSQGSLQELSTAWKPLIRRGVGRFLALPADRQAELAPLIQAIQKLPLKWQ